MHNCKNPIMDKAGNSKIISKNISYWIIPFVRPKILTHYQPQFLF